MALKLFCKLFSEFARNAIARLQMLKYDISTLLDIGMRHLILSVKAGQVEPHFRPALVPHCQSITDLLILLIRIDTELHHPLTEHA